MISKTPSANAKSQRSWWPLRARCTGRGIPRRVTHPRIGSVFKWLSKVITCLRLLFLAIGLKSRASFSTNEKTNTNGTLYVRFFRALSRLQLIADWFIALFAPVVIGRSNYLIIRFSQSFENRSNPTHWKACNSEQTNFLLRKKYKLGWNQTKEFRKIKRKTCAEF